MLMFSVLIAGTDTPPESQTLRRPEREVSVESQSRAGAAPVGRGTGTGAGPGEHGLLISRTTARSSVLTSESSFQYLKHSSSTLRPHPASRRYGRRNRLRILLLLGHGH
jgi:hypothetical protein